MSTLKERIDRIRIDAVCKRLDALVDRFDWGDYQKQKIGATKTRNGRTYVLNKNRRWELADKPNKKVKLPEPSNPETKALVDQLRRVMRIAQPSAASSPKAASSLPSVDEFKKAKLQRFNTGIQSFNQHQIYTTTINGKQYFVKGLEGEHSAIAEKTTQQTAKVLGVPVLESVSFNHPSRGAMTATPMLDGKSIDQLGSLNALKKQPDQALGKALMFDFLIGNYDRNHGNVFIDRKRGITLIDHDMAFDSFTKFPSGTINAFADALEEKGGMDKPIPASLKKKMLQDLQKGLPTIKHLDKPAMIERARVLAKAKTYRDLFGEDDDDFVLADFAF